MSLGVLATHERPFALGSGTESWAGQLGTRGCGPLCCPVGGSGTAPSPSALNPKWLLSFAVLPLWRAGSRDPSHTRIDTSWMSKQVCGSTVGIVGLGRIGHAVAARCLAFGASVAYHQRHRALLSTEALLGGAAWCDTLEALLESSDLVVLCCACTAETRGMIASAQLSRMRPGAVLVNIGRGALVDQEAIAAALERGALGGYATDVTDPEPLPDGHALLRAPRCIVTPHTGSATSRTRRAMLDLALANVAAALAGQTMPASPNQEAVAAKAAESRGSD